MAKSSVPKRKRINVTLSPETIRLLDRVAPKGDRSRFIDEAVRTYVATKRRASPAWLLKEGAQARAGRDLGLAGEWSEIDDETWYVPRRRT